MVVWFYVHLCQLLDYSGCDEPEPLLEVHSFVVEVDENANKEQTDEEEKGSDCRDKSLVGNVALVIDTKVENRAGNDTWERQVEENPAEND